jgi:hypothetical protein
MMLRLLRGEKDKTIYEDMGISQNRFSIIKHSPLFQIELNKMMAKREEKLYSIQDNFLDAAELGVKFQKEVLESQPGTHTIEQKLKAATTMTVLASRLLRPGQPSNGNGDLNESGLSYEERLKRVTIEESIRTVTHPQPQEIDPIEIDTLLAGDYPPSSELELGNEEDILFGESEVEDDIFNPPVKIEETLARAGGEKT